MTRRTDARRGSAVLEMTLVGIGMIFVLISTVEIARGMWIYHAVTYAVRDGTRYTIVHGKNCSINPNSCTVTIGQIAARIRAAGTGLMPDALKLTFTTSNGSATTCTLTNCLTTTSVWPPSSANAPGDSITITASYPFHSAIAMFWPGAGAGASFQAVNFSASSTDIMQF